jgi:glucosamine--fructose-6-phosphate aminotransferase (isomerizing)
MSVPSSPPALEGQIASQPDELARLLEEPIPHAVIEGIRQAHRLWLVGTGTSQHAAELGAEGIAPDALSRVPDAVRAAIATPGVDAIETPDRLLVIAGEGPASVTAREGALKVREASRFPAEGYDVEALLHGHAVPLRGRDRLVLVTPPDTDGLLAGVGDAAEAEGIAVTRLHEPADLPPLLAQIPLTARLQLLALRFAIERGFDPDVAVEGAWADEGLWAIGSPRSPGAPSP